MPHSYADLRRQAVDFVAQFAPLGPVLILAPARAAADEVAIQACANAIMGVRRLAFREFVIELSASELNRRALIPVGRFVREALAARVTARAIQQNQLTYLRPVAAFPGFPRALTATFEELRLNAVDLDRLRSCGESGPDLALLLDAYTYELTERQFADHAARVHLARDAFSASFNTLRQTAVAALDLAPRSILERELLDSVLKAARTTFAPTVNHQPPRTALESLQRNLFSTALVPPAPDDATVVIRSTSGEALECVEIARAIHASGIPFDQTAILLRSPDRHQPLILEALRRAAIPAFCTAGARRPDVAGRSLLALLHCAEEGLSASRFAEYLSLSPGHTAHWERLLVDAAVIGGVARWQTRLAGLREELHKNHAAEEDEDARDFLARRIASLEYLTGIALPVIARLAALPKLALWGEWIAALAALAESTIPDPETILESLEELEPMSAIGPVSLAEILLVLGPRLNSLTHAPRESRFGKVFVASIEEARAMSFRHVFLPGVNEGLFPRPPAEDPLLLHAQRDKLAIQLRADDAELLTVAVACASERLHLSFSTLDLLTGRPRVPSFYALEAHRAAGGPEISVREFDERARAATQSRIGWPAPVNPSDAIDDAEFDLATLAPRAPGSGQYLKRLPGRSVESLRARWARWHKAWKPADGLIVEEIGSDTLKLYFLTNRPWSPSTLQQYARCPYRFALRGIFGLRTAERPTGVQRMDPITRGLLYHAVQAELLSRPDPLARLDAVLTAVAARFEADLAPAIPQIWRAEVDALRADLRGWLQLRERDVAWTPQSTELAFGRDPVIQIDGGFQLKGAIDLVERHASGILRVVDHKTGRAGSADILQPALYALALEKILGEPVSFGRLYYATIAQNYAITEVPLNEFTRQRTAHTLRVIDAAMRDGFLPAAPREDACKRCEYLPVCGPYEEERIAEKSQPELKPLKELRQWR
jgi:RecB family exonuclease